MLFMQNSCSASHTTYSMSHSIVTILVPAVDNELIQILYNNSEVCHPRCVFKLYGDVNSVKNTTINIWLNDGVY